MSGYPEYFTRSLLANQQQRAAEQQAKNNGYEEWRKDLPENLREESPDYDLRGAYNAGMQPTLEDDGYHLGSRDPKTGRILKKPTHPSFNQAINADIAMGYKAYTGTDGEIYTLNENPPEGYTPYEIQDKEQKPLSPPPPYVPGEPYLESFKQKEEPKAPDEKKFKKSIRVASIAQALAIMGDAFGAYKGANVKERKDNALEPVAARQRQLRDIYEQRLEKYKDAGDAARAQDAAMKEAWRQREYQRELAEYQLKEQRLYNEGQKIDYQVKKDAGGGKQQKIKYTPEQRVEISKEFRKIPFEFISEHLTLPVRKVKKPDPHRYNQTIEVDEKYIPNNLDYGDMLEIILRYDESKKKPDTTTTPAPAQQNFNPSWNQRIKIEGF